MTLQEKVLAGGQLKARPGGTIIQLTFVSCGPIVSHGRPGPHSKMQIDYIRTPASGKPTGLLCFPKGPDTKQVSHDGTRSQVAVPAPWPGDYGPAAEALPLHSQALGIQGARTPPGASCRASGRLPGPHTSVTQAGTGILPAHRRLPCSYSSCISQCQSETPPRQNLPHG